MENAEILGLAETGADNDLSAKPNGSTSPFAMLQCPRWQSVQSPCGIDGPSSRSLRDSLRSDATLGMGAALSVISECFMLGIGNDCRPRSLERQNQHEENQENAFHRKRIL